MGPPRGPRPRRRDRRGCGRSPHAFPDGRASTTPIPRGDPAPAGTSRPGRGVPLAGGGPGFRHDQHRWIGSFPFPGSGAEPTGASTPPSSTSPSVPWAAATSALYQAGTSAKYIGHHQLRAAHAHRPEPLVAPGRAARRRGGTWRGFSYLSDVVTTTCADAPGVGCTTPRAGGTTVPVVMPDRRAGAVRRPSTALTGVRGSYLAYRTDVFHRGRGVHRACGARFLLNASFKIAGQDWVGYNTAQSRVDLARLGHLRRGVHTRRVGAVRIPPAGASHLERGTHRRDAAPLPWPRHRSWRSMLGA